MNQGRIWCVVHPTVGLPLLLGSVAATSLIVHACIMTHTTWMSTYWMGKAARVASLNTGASQTAMATSGTQAVSVKVTPVAATPTSQASFVITVSPAAAVPADTRLAVDTKAGDTKAGKSPGLIHTASAN